MAENVILFFVSFITLWGLYLVYSHFRRRALEEEREQVSERERRQQRQTATRLTGAQPPGSTLPSQAEAAERRKDLSKAIPLGVVLKTSEEEIMGDFGEGREVVPLETSCPICLVDYEHGESIRSSANCSHVFHDTCLFAWLEKDHDDCPCCRTLFVDPELGNTANNNNETCTPTCISTES